MVTGGYDVMAEFVVRGGPETYAGRVQDLQSIPGIDRWRSDLVLHVYKVGHAWGEQLYHESIGHPESAPVREPTECEPGHLDEMDWRLVAELQREGRQTFAALGHSVGIDATNARRRLERLRAEGCVDIVTLVPAAALGFGSETIVMVQIEPGLLEDVATALAGYSAVRYMAALLDENSLMCEVIAPTTDQLYRFISGTLAHLAGVRSWTAATELLSLKRGFVETPWWRQLIGAPPRRDPAARS
jgi:DNA-binding Lrp family transcriptional regulator